MHSKNYRKISATVITGFLGSGKTTLLRNLLRHAGGRRIAIIVNEFGELGIDGEILKGCGLDCGPDRDTAGNLYELANGCLCCTVQEEFYPVMQKLIARRNEIDHIVIETSGLALPKPLVQAFRWPEIRNACTVDAVICVVDTPAVAAGQFAASPDAVQLQREADDSLDHQSSLHELFEDQLSAADLVVLSKTDLADEANIAAVATLVEQELPPQVRLVRSAANGVDASILLGLQRCAEDSIHLRASHHDQAHGDEHTEHDHDQFESIVIELETVEKEPLLAALEKLARNNTLYRIKGFVSLPDKPMRLVVHGVGTRFDSYFDRRWPAGATRRTRLVLIGKDLDPADVRQQLAAQIGS